MSAKEENAYPGVNMHRTVAIIDDAAFGNPVVLDLYRVSSTTENEYDFPFYFQGQVMTTNFEYVTEPSLNKMGEEFGYQHLFQEAHAKPLDNMAQLSWFNENRFYTITTSSPDGDELLFGRIGATDPSYNLRRDPVFIVRRKGTSNTLFATTYEVNGGYSPVTEIGRNTYSEIKSLNVLQQTDEYSVVEINHVTNGKWIFAMSNTKDSKDKIHTLTIGEQVLEWTGSFHLIQIN